MNTNQANLASEAFGRKVIVFHSNLNTNQAHLASEASGRTVQTNLNTNQANPATEAYLLDLFLDLNPTLLIFVHTPPKSDVLDLY